MTSSILKGHYNKAFEDLKFVIDTLGYNVKSVRLINSNYCAESYPCQGHGGVKITYDDNKIYEYDCPSVSSGAIMVFYKSTNGATTDSHCRDYIDDDFKDYLLKAFKQ